jgi:hypothetical protein
MVKKKKKPYVKKAAVKTVRAATVDRETDLKKRGKS